jgi:hypothetical protein
VVRNRLAAEEQPVGDLRVRQPSRSRRSTSCSRLVSTPASFGPVRAAPPSDRTSRAAAFGVGGGSQPVETWRRRPGPRRRQPPAGPPGTQRAPAAPVRSRMASCRWRTAASPPPAEVRLLRAGRSEPSPPGRPRSSGGRRPGRCRRRLTPRVRRAALGRCPPSPPTGGSSPASRAPRPAPTPPDCRPGTVPASGRPHLACRARGAAPPASAGRRYGRSPARATPRPPPNGPV